MIRHAMSMCNCCAIINMSAPRDCHADLTIKAHTRSWHGAARNTPSQRIPPHKWIHLNSPSTLLFFVAHSCYSKNVFVVISVSSCLFFPQLNEECLFQIGHRPLHKGLGKGWSQSTVLVGQSSSFYQGE